jgi:hypothetical protein
MDATCTQRLAAEFRLPHLSPVAAGFLWVALAAWAATFAGLVWSLAALLRRRDARPSDSGGGDLDAGRRP